MVLSAYVLVPLQGAVPGGAADHVLSQGDNCATVHWINPCQGVAEPWSRALMRLLGVLEVAGGCC